MVKNNIKKKMLIFLVLFITIILGIFFVFATWNVPSNPGEGFRTNHSTRMQVWALGDCQHINNTNPADDFFIPTRTAAELNSFKAHPPLYVTSVPCTSPNVSVKRVSSWTGWVNMHTNDSGVWVHDPDCTSGANDDIIVQCRKWWPETYSYTFFANEHIYSWRARNCAAGYLENNTRPTYSCLLCTDISSSYTCNSLSPQCIWHSYGSGGCSRDYCYSYTTQSSCQSIGCYWAGNSCYGGAYCTDIAYENSCSMETTYYDGLCCWNSLYGTCEQGAC